MGTFVRDASPVTASAGDLRPARPAKFGAVRTITAAAEKINVGAVGYTPRTQQKWQLEAWEAYRRVGELHFGFTMKANLLSRIRVLAAVPAGPGDVPIPVLDSIDAAAEDQQDSVISRELATAANKALSELTDTGFESMCRTFSLNMDVVGEVLLAKLPTTGQEEPVIDPTTKAKVLDSRTGEPMMRPVATWQMRSTSELEVTTDGAKLKAGAGASNQTVTQFPATPKPYIARIWRPDPQFASEPDSSLMALGDDVQMLLMVSRMVRGAILSRLNAGILFVPDTMAPVPRGAAAEVPIDVDPLLEQQTATDPGADFLDSLFEAMVTPIGDEGSAANVVPVVLQGPGAEGANIKHITLERASDEWLASRTERYLERILQGADMPKELVQGLANVKYSNAIVITEDLYKSSIEPTCLTLVDALTRVYLRPVLMDRGFTREEVERVVVWYDPSEITTRSASSADANAGYESGLLSPQAWRREHGFGEGDAPSEDERAIRLVEKAQLPPETVQAFLKVAFPKILAEAQAANDAESPVPLPETARDLLRSVPDTDSPPPGGTPAPVPAVASIRR